MCTDQKKIVVKVSIDREQFTIYSLSLSNGVFDMPLGVQLMSACEIELRVEGNQSPEFISRDTMSLNVLQLRLKSILYSVCVHLIIFRGLANIDIFKDFDNSTCRKVKGTYSWHIGAENMTISMRGCTSLWHDAALRQVIDS